MLFPLADDDRRLTGPAYVTLLLLAANVFVYVFLQDLGTNEAFTYGWSVIPQEVTTGTDVVGQVRIGGGVAIEHTPGPIPIYLTVLSAMFMHGGLLHLGGNLLYLWIFGDNVEHRFGAVTFLLFYLACGLAATFAQVALDPDGLIPNLGASGAISGVLGAYLVLFPRNEVRALLVWFVVRVPAVVVLGLWIALQFFDGYGSLVAAEQTGGVAYGAHIGGFVAGVVGAFVLRRARPPRLHEKVISRPAP
jgi:membrane associated rhomboid family serine protease